MTDFEPVSGQFHRATIYALSTAIGRSGVAIIRLSGPLSFSALEQLASGVRRRARLMQRVHLSSPDTGRALDDGLAVWFEGPASFTGEDVVELHVHGGRAVVAGILDALGRLSGLHLAEPGAFTRQAFENGKLDLTEVEGLADLIDAETECQLDQALRQMSGGLSAAAEDWRSSIIAAQAFAEAAIDFSDEGDVSAGALGQARARVIPLVADLAHQLSDGHRGEILRDGFRVAVAGPPNAGKSSLINRLSGRDAVIVSEEAGTTRDVVELHLNLEGVRVIVADTAGVRATDGLVEREGIRRGLAWAQTAHLVLWLQDSQGQPTPPPEDLGTREGEILSVKTKTDLNPSFGAEPAANAQFQVGAELGISSTTGSGFNHLVAAISEAAQRRTGGGAVALITQARHRKALEDAREALEAFLRTDDRDTELGAEHLRRAAVSLARLTGRIDVEDVLGAIFSQFCIGK